jgi:hypothetical protein
MRLKWILVIAAGSVLAIVTSLVQGRGRDPGAGAARGGPVGWAAARWSTVRIEGVPHVLQKPDFCGEACAEMYLAKLGHPIRQDDVFEASGLEPVQGRGCRTSELNEALKKIGFKTGAVWHEVKAGEPPLDLWTEVHADLKRGIPSIVCMRTAKGPEATEHFRLVLGYDAETDEVLYHEPAEKDGAYRRMKRGEFLELWPLKYSKEAWTVIRFCLEPGRIDATKIRVGPIEAGRKREGLSQADYAQHIRKLKAKVPPKGFTILIEKPFVVVGDEAPDAVRGRAEHTVKWAVERLKKAYFEEDPLEIIDIWLFKDKESYEKHSWEIFRDKPSTPFGYYSEEHHALVMNIDTGGGTLVHEIVHPFMKVNFPACPAWLNEGLASLYEQSQGEGARIIGLPNWRLPGLQEAIRKKRVPSFKDLTGTTSQEFYREDRGTNYAQARYLCHYLQEKGLLERFYRAFRSKVKEDPTGYGTLQEILGEKDMDAFKLEWEAFVLGLRFP